MEIINSVKYKTTELIVLFILLPILLAVPIAKWLKFAAVLLAISYVVYVSYKLGYFKEKYVFTKPTKRFWIRVLVIGTLILVFGYFVVLKVDEVLLFKMVKTKPFFWIVILCVYAFLSVVPQELIYRKYFFKRYHSIFGNTFLFFAINVFCFSFCHLFLHNILVLVLTAIGGVLFVYTYHQEKNITSVIIEHSLYGNLIFTLGIGEMLAFPS